MDATARADTIARSLAQRGVDPNELAKAFTHLRAFLERAGSDEQARQQAADRWWQWLETVAGPGARAVVRSNQTRAYHNTILDACRLHVDDLDPDALAEALGWAVRLVRYYQSVPGALQQPSPFGEHAPAPRRERPRPVAARPAEPPQPRLPAAGDIYTGKILNADESMVIVEVPGLSDKQALGAMRGVDGRRYRPGNAARVEVVSLRQVKGRTIVELKPAPKQQK